MWYILCAIWPQQFKCGFISLNNFTKSAANPTHLTHWSRVTHICDNKQSITGRRQTIIWTNAGILLIGSLIGNLIESQTYSLKKMHLKMSVKWQPSCLGFNVLSHYCDIVVKIFDKIEKVNYC